MTNTISEKKTKTFFDIFPLTKTFADTSKSRFNESKMRNDTSSMNTVKENPVKDLTAELEEKRKKEALAALKKQLIKKVQQQREDMKYFNKPHHDHPFKPVLAVKADNKTSYLNGVDNPLLSKKIVLVRKKPVVSQIMHGNYLKESAIKPESNSNLKRLQPLKFVDFDKPRFNIVRVKKEPVKGVIHNEWKTNPPQSIVEERILKKVEALDSTHPKPKNYDALINKASMIMRERAEKVHERLIDSYRNHRHNVREGRKLYENQNIEDGLVRSSSSGFKISKTPRFKLDSALNSTRSRK